MEFLRELDARLAAAGHLCGAEPGLADAAIMPFVRQFAAVDREWFSDQALQRLHAWLESHIASPLFHSVMVRSEPWSSDEKGRPG